MKPGWRAEWVKRRNRLLADPAFQRFAWAFPPFRGIARGRADRLFGLVAGFTYSQLIAAGVQLELFPLLQEGPKFPGDVAASTGLSTDAATDLIAGLASIGMTERLPDGSYVLGVHGAAFMADPGLAAMVRHNQLFYVDLADPVALLRQRGGGKVANYWPYSEGRAEQVAPYSELMAASQPAVAAAVLEGFAFKGVTRLMDVGGGEGAFLQAVGAAHPQIALMLFDLPEVAERARVRLGARAQVFGGQVPADALPKGADCISFIRVLHDHDDAEALAMLQRAAEALPQGGQLLVAEPMAGEGGAATLGDVYFRLYMRAMGRGRPRSPAEIMEMLRSTGFRDVQQHPTANPYAAQIVSGRRNEASVKVD